MRYLVGIDEGTGSCKVCVFDETGASLASASREYASYYPQPGYVEQDIFEIKKAVFDACREAVVASKVRAEDIAGVSHSNQGITMVLLDEDGTPCRTRTIGWQDMRYTDVLDQMRNCVDVDHYRAVTGMPFGVYNTAVLRWLQEREPNMWERVVHVCSHQDYFLKALGADGYFIDEGSANFMGMVDLQTGEWSPELVALFGLRLDQLPVIVHGPGRVVGHVPPEVASETGLPVGCAVVVGGLDTNSCTLAAGGIDPGVEVMVVGTAGTSTFIAPTALRDPRQRVTTRSNPGVGNWQLYTMTNTAASSFRWFRDSFGQLEVAASGLLRVDPYDVITSIASTSEPGARGVTFVAALQGQQGRRSNERARGSILGITLATQKADVAQALMEGICFEMFDLLRLTEDFAGPATRVRLSGGVTKSPMWCQMFADVMQRPIELTKVTDMGALGAAMAAGIGAGVFSSTREAVERAVSLAATYQPSTANRDAYGHAYERWCQASDALNSGFYLTSPVSGVLDWYWVFD